MIYLISVFSVYTKLETLSECAKAHSLFFAVPTLYSSADIRGIFRKSLKQHLSKRLQQPLILLRQHHAKPHKMIIQKRKRRTIPDHQSLPDTMIEQILGSNSGFPDLHQDKICRSLINRHTVPRR